MISIDAACSSKRRRNMPGNTAKRRRTCSGGRTAIVIACRAGRANAKQEGQIPAKAVGDERPVFLEPRHEPRFRETGLPRPHPCELGRLDGDGHVLLLTRSPGEPPGILHPWPAEHPQPVPPGAV